MLLAINMCVESTSVSKNSRSDGYHGFVLLVKIIHSMRSGLSSLFVSLRCCPLNDSRWSPIYCSSCLDIMLLDGGFYICNDILNWYEVWCCSKMSSSRKHWTFYRWEWVSACQTNSPLCGLCSTWEWVFWCTIRIFFLIYIDWFSLNLLLLINIIW